MLRFSMWKTVRETPSHFYQQHRWTKARRAMPAKPNAGEPFHADWLRGGEFRRTRSPGSMVVPA